MFCRILRFKEQKMIEVKNLTKRYGSKTAVSNVSFTAEESEILGFLGPNGAGKSTTMNILTGYLSSTEGEAKINGIDILEEPVKAKQMIGYLPEQPPLYLDMTVMEYLKFVYGLKKCKLPINSHLKEICNLVKITDVKDRVIKNLSKGYKQRVGLAQALVGNPPVLILDEPTNDLDIETMTILEDYLDDFDGIVITVSHDRYFLDRIVTRIFAFEENGAIRQYEGGYTDYVKKRPASTENSFDGKTKSHTGNKEARMVYKNREKKLKFSYQEQREYETIEEDISVLETTIETLDQEMAENGTDYVKLRELSEKKDEAEEQLMEKMERWEYLEELAEKIANQ